MPDLTLHFNDTIHALHLPEGAPLFPALTGAGVDFGSNCGGRGACGKCRVNVIAGDFPPPGEHERRALSDTRQF